MSSYGKGHDLLGRLIECTLGLKEKLKDLSLFTLLLLLEKVSLYSKDWLGTHGTAQAVLELEKSGYSDLDLPFKAISYLTEQVVSPFFGEMILVNC